MTWIFMENGATNSATQYFAMPFILGIEKMQRLLIADFKSDTEFEAIEPQLFNDETNGKGLRVLRYRKNKKVDVYWEKGVKVNLADFVLGAGIEDFAEVDMIKNTFKEDDRGINIDITFTDKQKRLVEFVVRENTNNKNRLNFLAPVGNEINSPKQLFFAFMKEFDFIRTHRTQLYGIIGSSILRFSNFPLLRNFQPVKFIRYSLNPVVPTINHQNSDIISIPLTNSKEIEYQDNTYYFNDAFDITRISKLYLNSQINIYFTDGFLNLTKLDNLQQIAGDWILQIDEYDITGGTYSMNRQNDIIQFNIKPEKNWKTTHLPISLKIFTKLAAFFRTWPTTYYYSAIIDRNNLRFISSNWSRV